MRQNGRRICFHIIAAKSVCRCYHCIRRLYGIFHDLSSLKSSLISVYPLTLGSRAILSASSIAAFVRSLGVQSAVITKGILSSRRHWRTKILKAVLIFIPILSNSASASALSCASIRILIFEVLLLAIRSHPFYAYYTSFARKCQYTALINSHKNSNITKISRKAARNERLSAVYNKELEGKLEIA